MLRRAGWTFLLLLVSGVVFVASFVGGLLEAPFPSDASAPASGIAYLLDAHGHPYAQIKPVEQRTPLAKYSDIGQTMVDAIVAAEDERYFSHGGVDPLAIIRAAISDVTGGAPSGASTITQQYVKNVYTNKQHTILRKVKEAGLAVRLDRAKSKQEILRLYLNSIYFGNNNYGIEAAAKYYFNKDSKNLDCGEAAMLAGLVSAPSAHEPVNHFAAAKVRQKYVLGREEALGMLSAEDATNCYNSITPASILVHYTGPPRTSYPEYTDLVDAQLKALGPDLLQNGDAIIHTSLDEDLDNAAKQALASVLPSDKDPEAVVVGVNPKTGDVTTIATQGQPARDGKPAGYQRFGLDIATDQYPISGSTIKPFTLAAALASGKYSLSYGYPGPPEKTITVPGCTDAFDVMNAEPDEGGYFSLETGLAQSVNTVYAQLAVDVGLSKVKKMATAAGIPTAFTSKGQFLYGFDGNPKKGSACPVVPSQSLGVAVSPLDMDTAYATIADGGTYRPQRFITGVQIGSNGPKDTSGTYVELPKLAATHRAMSQSVATDVQTAMRQVVTVGTAQPTLGDLPNTFTDLIGKTGTTQGENNAWFIGCLPQLCLAVWMGNDKPYQQVDGKTQYDSKGDPIPNTLNGTEGVNPVFGGTLPAKIFLETMQYYQQNLKQSGQPPLTKGSLGTPSPGVPVNPPSDVPTYTYTAKPTGKATPTKKSSATAKPSAKSSSQAPVTQAPTSAAPPPTTAPTTAAPPTTTPTTAPAQPTVGLPGPTPTSS